MKEHRIKFKIITSQTDAQNRLTPEALASFFQEAALFNVKELGVSHTSLFEKDLGWILMRLTIEWNTMPKQGDTIEILTWPSGNNRLYFYRDYRVFCENGELIAKAASTWVLAKISTKKILPVPEFLSKLSINVEPPMERKNNKLPLAASDQKPYSIEVGWQDLDYFMHTNNPVYLRWIMNALPNEIVKSKEVKFLDISYRAESKLGEKLEAISGKISENKYSVVINRTRDGKELVRASIILSN